MDNPVAVTGTTYNGRYMPDGSIELTLVIPSNEVNPFSARLMQFGTNVGLVALAFNPANWGREAHALFMSGFFRTPAVWQAIASDAHYQAWVRKQPSAHSKRQGTEDDPIVYAHVRRVRDGAGSSIKPLYCGIPLLNSEHRLQHQKGESGLRPKEGKAWFDKQRVVFVTLWGWETLKAQLGFEHWPQVPPETLFAWAEKNNVTQYLPACYRQGTKQGRG